MIYASFQKIIGTVQSIRSGNNCFSQMISVWTENGIVNFIITKDTQVIDCIRIRIGMRVAVFYDTNLPAPAIYPPQYQAELITSLRRNQDVYLGYFDETLTAEDQSLKLNLSPTTNVETANGQRFLCDPGNEELLVYYTMTTFSIPPQTTPQRIVVMSPGK